MHQFPSGRRNQGLQAFLGTGIHTRRAGDILLGPFLVRGFHSQNDRRNPAWMSDEIVRGTERFRIGYPVCKARYPPVSKGLDAY